MVPEPGLLRKALAFAGGVVVLALGLTFSVLLLVVIVAIALVVWAYSWWRTRELRRTLRERPSADAGGGVVVEGEAMVVEEVRQSAVRRGTSEADARNDVARGS